jgi:hypothetical protein
MGGGDLATMMDVITGLDVAEEKEFHPMYEEKKGRLQDVPKWDEATERGHSELIRVGAAIDVNGCTVTRRPTSIIQQFQHNINKTTDLGHCTWPPGLQCNCSVTEKTIILPQIANYFKGELDPLPAPPKIPPAIMITTEFHAKPPQISLDQSRGWGGTSWINPRKHAKGATHSETIKYDFQDLGPKTLVWSIKQT